MADPPRVVLVGAGHAHLEVARRGDAFARRGVAFTLVDPGRFWYSGLATGMLGGMYRPEQDQLDPRPLVEGRGGRFIRDRVVGLDRARRTVTLAGGAELPYDALSFNVGSEVPVEALSGGGAGSGTNSGGSGVSGGGGGDVEPRPGCHWLLAASVPGERPRHWQPAASGTHLFETGDASRDRPCILPVKPIANLYRLRAWLEHLRAEPPPGRPVSLLVVGGGPTGCEVAANLHALAHRLDLPVSLTLLARGSRLLKDHPAGAAKRMARELARREVAVVLDCAVRAVEPGQARTQDGRTFPFDLLVAATGLRPPALLRELGLPLGREGGLHVAAPLHAVDDDRVFGAGDCIDFASRPLPRVGVHGVRQAPVLLHNLLARVTAGRLRPYRPQKHCLTILNLGQGQGLALRGRWWWCGRASLWLKDRLDRRFLHRLGQAVAAERSAAGTSAGGRASKLP